MRARSNSSQKMSYFELTDQQQALLTMAFGEPARVQELLRSYQNLLLEEDLEVSIHRMLPLLARSFTRSGVEPSDPAAVQCAKVARVYWLKSGLLAQRISPVLSALQENAIPVMLLKGSAVVWHLDGDVGARPMDDIDLLVPRSNVPAALNALRKLGFREDLGSVSDRELDALIRERHAFGLTGHDGAQLDLHWHPISCARNETVDNAFWERAQPASLANIPCLVSSLEDSMVHTVAHAFGNRPFVQMRWAPDLYLLAARHRDEIDWGRIVEMATSCRIQSPMHDALDSLRRVTDFEVPGTVLAALRRPPFVEASVARPRFDHAGHHRTATRAECRIDTYNEFLSSSDPAVNAGVASRWSSFLARHWALPRRRFVLRHAILVLLGRPWILRRQRRFRPTSQPKDASAQHVSFCLGGTGLDHLGVGWSNPEAHGTWTLGSEATVHLSLPSSPSCCLVVTLTPFRSPGHQRLDIEISVNERQRSRWTFTGSTWQTERLDLELDGGVVNPEGLDEIRFVIRHPMSPSEACFEPGTRALGISLAAIDVVSVS